MLQTAGKTSTRAQWMDDVAHGVPSSKGSSSGDGGDALPEWGGLKLVSLRPLVYPCTAVSCLLYPEARRPFQQAGVALPLGDCSLQQVPSWLKMSMTSHQNVKRGDSIKKI